MNRIYKTIWNERAGTFVAVSEISRSHGKRSGASVDEVSRHQAGGGRSGKHPGKLLLTLSAATLAMCLAPGAVFAIAGSAGGQVPSGILGDRSGSTAIAPSYDECNLFLDDTGRDRGTLSNPESEAIAKGKKAVAIGCGAYAGTESVAIGIGSGEADLTQSVSLGYRAGNGSTGAYNTYIGYQAGMDSRNIKNATAIGANTRVMEDDGVALGSGSVANTGAGVAGFDPSTGRASIKTDDAAWHSTLAAVSVGSNVVVDGEPLQQTRQITNVAAGFENTDAVNVAQLKAVDNAASKPLTFADSANNKLNRKLGETVKISGADRNITTHIDQRDHSIKIALSKDIDLGDQGSITTGNSKLNDEGLTVGGTRRGQGTTAISTDGMKVSSGSGRGSASATYGSDKLVFTKTRGHGQSEALSLSADDGFKMGNTALNGTALTIGNALTLDGQGLHIGKNGPRVTTRGLYAGGMRITGVKDATHDTDAVNLRQLEYATTKLQGSIDNAKTHFYSVNGTDAKAGNYDNKGATGKNALAAGVNAKAAGDHAVAVGDGAQANTENALSIGAGNEVNAALWARAANASATDSLAIGSGNTISAGVVGAANDVVAIGHNNDVQALLGSVSGSIVIGHDNKVRSQNVAVLGNSIEVGKGLSGAIVLGDNSKVTSAVKTKGAKITDEEGKNLLSLGDFAGSAVSKGDVLSVGAAGKERQIQNVAAGRVTADSTDAVNGSQLFQSTRTLGTGINQLAAALGTTMNLNGTIQAPTYKIQGRAYDTVSGAFAGVDTALTGGFTVAAGQYAHGQSAPAGTTYNIGAGGTLEIYGTDWIKAETRDGKVYISLADDFPVVAYPTPPVTPPSPPEPGMGNSPDAGAGNGSGNGLGNIVAGGDIVAGDNIAVEENGSDITISTTPTPEFDSITVGDVTIDKDAGIDAGGKPITGVADGEVAQGSQDAVNGGQLYQAAQDLTEKGMDFAANEGSDVHRDLGQTLAITGGATMPGEYSSDNIKTVATENGIEIQMAEDMKVNSITAVKVSADRVEISNGGPVIDGNGIDMSGQRITNVADGVEATDAANIGQLQAAAGSLQNQISDVRSEMHSMDRHLRAGIAAAMATAGLPQAYLPGKSMMAISGATWQGESGYAVGYSGISPNGHWLLKVSGNSSSRGDFGGAVGVGYQW